MKTMKTLITLWIAVLFAVSVFPVCVLAADKTVTSIVAEDVTVYFESDGRWMGNHPNGISGGDNFAWFFYLFTPDITVNYSDGSSTTVAFYDVISLLGSSPSISHDQSINNAWGLGDHIASVICGNFSDDFTVTVLPSPAVSIVAQDTTVRQYIDGSLSGPDLFLYTLNPILTVTFADGTVITGTRSDIEKQSGYAVYWNSDQGKAEEWGLGDHTATALFMGLRAEFTVTVIDVIASVEMITPPAKTELLYGEYVDLRGSVLRVHFTNGSYDDISPINTHSDNYGYYVHTVQQSCMLKYAPLRVTESGSQDITIRFLGKTVTFPVDVAQKPGALQLTDNEDQLLLTFDDGNGIKTYQILDFVSFGGANSWNGEVRKYGTLYTDGGLFLASIGKTVDKAMFIELGNPNYEGGVYAVSNTVSDIYWFDLYEGTLVYGDFNRDGNADTTDVRGLLKALSSQSGFNYKQTTICDVSKNGMIDTTDTRLILKELLT